MPLLGREDIVVDGVDVTVVVDGVDVSVFGVVVTCVEGLRFVCVPDIVPGGLFVNIGDRVDFGEVFVAVSFVVCFVVGFACVTVVTGQISVSDKLENGLPFNSDGEEQIG